MGELEKNNLFNVGIYLRLSREDEIKKSFESESIKNQKEYILKYIKEHNLNLVEIYIDDGVSGTSFDRPGFKKMINDIENKKINMVITKDLSRLGRDHIDTGNYIEKYFPIHQIRYVAINDGYDSLDQESNANDFAPLRNVFNDMYAKDISKKVRTSLYIKQTKGDFIGTYAPFGYIKDKNCKSKLIVDKEKVYIVKKIFQEYLKGKNIKSITDELTYQKIPSPTGKNIWNTTTLKRILKNEVYIGNTIGHKIKKINYKIKKQISIPESEWIRVENTHEKIIEKEDFDAVQKILKIRSYNKTSSVNHLFTGIIYCANCNSKFTFINAYRKSNYYTICTNVKKYGNKNSICNSKSFKEEKLNYIVIEKLKEIIKKYIDEKYILNKLNLNNKNHEIEQLKQQKEKIKKELEISKETIIELYKDKVQKNINEEIFNQCIEKIVEVQKQNQTKSDLLDLQLKDIRISNDVNKEELLEEFLSFNNIDRNIVIQLINKITIDTANEKNKIIIYLNFCCRRDIDKNR